jgi:transposase
MFRLSPDLLQQLWDLRAAGASLRKVAAVLRISRNTVRRHVRGATHGSAFPPPLEPPREWPARARALIVADPSLTARAISTRLRTEGLEVSMRSVQRELAKWREECAQTLDLEARAPAFQPSWDTGEMRQVS